MQRIFHATVGAVLLVAFGALVRPETAQAHWLKATTSNFIIYDKGSEAHLRDVATELERFDLILRLIARRTDLPPARIKLPIYLVRGTRDLRVVAPYLSSDVEGFYHAGAGAMFAMAQHKRSGGLEAQEVLFHEYAHHFMREYFPAAYPAWYVEGFAEFVSTVKFKGTRVELGRYIKGRALDLNFGPWIPFSRLMQATPSDLEREDKTYLFYSQSWLLTHYLLSDPERDRKFDVYLRRVADGENAWTAFEQIFGLDDDQLRQTLQDYARAKMPYLTFDGSQFLAGEISVETMPGSADNLLLPRLSAETLAGRSDAKDVLAKIQRLAAQYPGDPFARNSLAIGEIAFGDPNDAIATLGPIDALAGDAEGLYLHGLADAVLCFPNATETVHRQAARDAFGAAFKLKPNHYQTLYRYVQTFLTENKPVPDGVMDVLLRANELAPQVDEIAVNAAIVLMQRLRFSKAIALLGPVANNPHGGGLAKQAGELLKTAKRKQAPTVGWINHKPVERAFK